jgi:hypothetical protein
VHHPSDVLQLAEEVCGHTAKPAQAAQGARGGATPVQAHVRRHRPAQLSTQRLHQKKTLMSAIKWNLVEFSETYKLQR